MKEIKPSYIENLQKGNVHWDKWGKDSIDQARKQKKLILLHTGRFSDATNRNKALSLFNNKHISNILNQSYITIYVDSYINSELYYSLLDLNLIIENKVSDFINVILLPDKIRPIISFSSLDEKEFLYNITHLSQLYHTNYNKLSLAANYLYDRLLNSGIVNKKETAKTLNDKVLHLYVKNWSKRFTDKELYRKRSPYTFNARFFVFLIKYGATYNIPMYKEKIEDALIKSYYSPMFDPIEGGMFRQAVNSTLKKPLYELDLNENIQLMYIYSLGYRFYKNPILKDAYENIYACILNRLRSDDNGYITSISPKENPLKCNYYKYTLKELIDNFPNNYIKIAKALGMDTETEEFVFQVISNTPEFSFISEEIKAKLLEIRKQRKDELIEDKRMQVGLNTLLAGTLCQISEYETNAVKQSNYLDNAGKIIRIVLNLKELKCSKYSLFDYALLINALINYSVCTKDNKYKEIVNEYVWYVISNFYQINTGVFNNKSHKFNRLLCRREGIMDYFKYSANSIMARNMFLMYKNTGHEFYIDIYKQLLYNIEPHLMQSGPYLTSWANELLNYLSFKPLNHKKGENYLRNSKI